MVARVLNLCGLYIGEDHELLPATPENPAGFWENSNFVQLNEELLNDFGGGWDHPPPLPARESAYKEIRRFQAKAMVLASRFKDRTLWGWKDPRNCLTLHYWKDVLSPLKTVICVRHPLEVAQSLHARNNFSFSHALDLWRIYNQRVLESTSPGDRVVTHYEAFLDNPRTESARLLEFLEVTVPEELLDVACGSVSVGLRHNRFAPHHLLEADLPKELIALYRMLIDVAGSPIVEGGNFASQNPAEAPAEGSQPLAATTQEYDPANSCESTGNDAPPRRVVNLAFLNAEKNRRQLVNAQKALAERDTSLNHLRAKHQAALAGHDEAIRAVQTRCSELEQQLAMRDSETAAERDRRAAETSAKDALIRDLEKRCADLTQLAIADDAETAAEYHHLNRELAAPDPSPSKRRRTELPFGVNIAGYIASEKGVGEGVRSDIRFLRAAGIPYVLNNYADPGSSNCDSTFRRFSETNPFRVNLIHVNADGMPEFVRRMGEDYFRDRYTIGYWAWELGTFPSEWSSSFQWLDEVWVPSTFAQDSIARSAPVPVVRVPHCLEESHPSGRYDRDHFKLAVDDYLFLFIFDFHSYFERKNPLGLIEAFTRAFRANDKARLIIKCSRADYDPAGYQAMQTACRNANIQIIDKVLSRDELNGLMASCDCYVSLHRSEGFGLTVAEAMNLGKPVIATAYSGNTDFMTPMNSFPVQYDLIGIDRDHGPYRQGQVWADPDTNHAAQLMRFVFENRETAASVGAKAQADVRRTLSPAAVGGLVEQRLEFIDERLAAHVKARRCQNVPQTNAETAPRALVSEPPEAYRKMIQRIAAIAVGSIPVGASVLVVSKGDDALLRFEGLRGQHFPQAADGTYAGYYPADSLAAIVHLEELRSRGAEYLLFPASALWWLKHYAQLAEYLTARFAIVAQADDCCVIFKLTDTAAPPMSAPLSAALRADERSALTSSLAECSIVIPVYNKAALTEQCLATLCTEASDDTNCEIIVVDDGSTDATPACLARYADRVRIVRHQKNMGFATACNDGAAVATGEFLVFLNNDTIPQKDWLTSLLRYSRQHPEAGIIGSKLLFPNDTIQHAGVVICQDRLPRHIYAGFPADHPAVNRSRRFRAVTGACLFIRRQLFLDAGGFDASFVNSCEDIDLCLRLGEMGYESHYCHESVLYHLESVTRAGRTEEESQNTRLYLSRWGHRAPPDDLQYYVEDGLLGTRYQALYPIPFEISPLLAVVDHGQRAPTADSLLNARTQEVLGLLKENTRLHVQLQEARHAKLLDWSAIDAATPIPAEGNGMPGRPEKCLPNAHCNGTAHKSYTDAEN